MGIFIFSDLTCGVEGAEREVSLRKLGDENGALSSQSITIYTNLINRKAHD